MAQFETPHALDNAEIKTLQENKNELSDDMKERLQDTQKRELFVSEYKNYLQRSQNEASKDMVTKLFGNIFDLAEKEGISMDEKEETAVVEGNNTTDGLAQGEGSTLSEGATDQLIQPGLRDNAEIVITEPIDIKKSYSEMIDYTMSEEFFSFLENLSNAPKISLEFKQIWKMIGETYKGEIEKSNLPTITAENINDAETQSKVENAIEQAHTSAINKMTSIFTEFLQKKEEEGRQNGVVGQDIQGLIVKFESMKNKPKESFSGIIAEIQGFKKFRKQIEGIERPQIPQINTADIASSDGKKELMPHRELSLAVFDQLDITRGTSFFDKKIDRKKGEKITIYYGEKGGWSHAPEELKITKKVNNGMERYTESVTMRCSFGKDGKPENAKSLSYFKKDKDGKIKEKTWSGSADSYDNVKKFLSSTLPTIADADLSEDLEKALA